MRELSSRTEPGGDVGDTYRGDEIVKIYDAAAGRYSWVESLPWDRQIVEELPDTLRPKTIYSLIESTGVSSVICRADGTLTSEVEFQNLGGQYLLDPNEINGWGAVGMFDFSNTQDLGNADAAALSRLASGFERPYDIQLLEFKAMHYNTSQSAEAWGWVWSRQIKNLGTTTSDTEIIINEAVENGNVGPRDYQSNTNQGSTIDLSGRANALVPAGEVVNLGVAAPTANPTNYYVRILSGNISFRRVFQ